MLGEARLNQTKLRQAKLNSLAWPNLTCLSLTLSKFVFARKKTIDLKIFQDHANRVNLLRVVVNGV